MSGIYIPGMELPKGLPLRIEINACGGVIQIISPFLAIPLATAIELPPHGRLVDVDALEKHMSDTVMGDIRGYPYDGDTWDLAFSWLDHADTIIPADGGDT